MKIKIFVCFFVFFKNLLGSPDMEVLVVSHDVGEVYKSKSEWLDQIEVQVTKGLTQHQVIFYPELFSLSLGSVLKFTNEVDLLRQVSEVYWNELVPKVASLSKRSQPSLIILGSSPYYNAISNQIFNRSAVIINGELAYQDKIHLTPWEKSFTSGKELQIFQFQNIKFVVTVCLDIEMPQVAYLLQKNSIDLIFVPSATEGQQGSERIQRTANARAVEIGAVTFVSPLIGKNPNVPLILKNLGQISRYLPSNLIFDLSEQKILSEILQGNGTQMRSFNLPVDKIKENKKDTGETKPFLLYKNEEIPVKKN